MKKDNEKLKYDKETMMAIWTNVFHHGQNSKGESYMHQLRSMTDLQEESGSIYVDFNSIDVENPDFAKYLMDYPLVALEAGRLALSEETQFEDAELRIVNPPKDSYVQISKIREKDIGKLVTIEGIIKRASEIRPRVAVAKFACRTCGNKISVDQLQDEELEYPKECDGDLGCGERKRFKLLTEETEWNDSQDLELMELPETMKGANQPERISCVADGDLTAEEVNGIRKRISAGDRVKLVGVLQAIPAKRNSLIYLPKLTVNSVEFIEHGYEQIILTEEDIANILIAAQDPYIVEKLSMSVASSIFGYETQKEAFFLQMMSGASVELPDGTRTRGHIHIFLIGDPGVAKTQFLIAVKDAAPRGVFATGGQTSGVGLTAAAVKDDATGRWTLEGGALVFANGGIACIDEIDKMNPADRGAMHEAMESGHVTVTKAGINAELPTKCSIAGGANPKFGRFIAGTPVTAQVDMPPSLLSRFDLIFVMRDIPDEKKDTNISKHILKRRVGIVTGTHYDTEFLTKYIAYARDNVKNVTYTQEADEFIQTFYVALRKKSNPDAGTISITPRQIEGICRLAEASARARISSVVSLDDAKRAVRLVDFCLRSVSMEDGNYDIDIMTTGISSKKRGRIDTANQIFALNPDGFTVEEFAKELGVSKQEADEVIETLSKKGNSIYKDAKGKWKCVN